LSLLDELAREFTASLGSAAVVTDHPLF